MLRLTSFIASLPSYFTPSTTQTQTHDVSSDTSLLFPYTSDDDEELEDDAFESETETITNAKTIMQSQFASMHSSVTSRYNSSSSSSSSSSLSSSALTFSSSSSSPPPLPVSFSCAHCHCHSSQVTQSTLSTTPSTTSLCTCKCTSNSALKTTKTTATTNDINNESNEVEEARQTLQLRHSMQSSTNASRRRFASASFPSASSTSPTATTEGKYSGYNDLSHLRRRSADDIAYLKEIGSYLRRVSEEFDRSSRSNVSFTITSISPFNSRSF